MACGASVSHLVSRLLVCAFYLTFSGVAKGTLTDLRNGTSTLELHGANLHCRITIVTTTLLTNVRERSKRRYSKETVCIPLQAGRFRDRLLPIQLPTHILDTYRPSIMQGNLVLRLDNVYVHRHGVQLGKHSGISVVENRSIRYLTESINSQGNQSMIIVRVSTRDSSPPITMKELEVSVFGDGVSLKTQYQMCSHGQLNFQHQASIDLVVNASISDFAGSGSDLFEAARDQMVQDLDVESLDDLADRIIFCLAPTSGWVARTAVNHNRIVINGDYCQHLHVKAHETGHSTGLYHSWLGDQHYGDLTCNMGGTAVVETAVSPQKCFNAYNHYKLGWFSSHHLEVDPFTPTLVLMASFVDYDKVSDHHVVIVSIGDQYFLQFNRKALFNIGTEMMANKIVVVQNLPGHTDLVAGLDVGEMFVIPNYGGSFVGEIIIQVCDRIAPSDYQPEAMIVSIGVNVTNC